MPLEKIIRKHTLADGFMANDRLKRTVIALSGFYGVNALLIGASLIYLTLTGSNGVSPLSRLIAALGEEFLLNLLFSTIGATVLTGFIACALWLSAHLRLPLVSLLTALLSALVHLCNLALFALLAGSWFFAALNRSDRGVNLEYILQRMGFSGSKDPAAIILLVVCGTELLLWIILLLPAVVRSFRALASSTKRVPGPYSYSYASVVMSGAQRGNEIAFLENALDTRGSFMRYDEDLEDIYDTDRYLVRFLHRNGQVLAASLQQRRSKELMAIFSGKENRALNIEVLLEDSYELQRAKRGGARAVIRRSQDIEEAALAAGWTVVGNSDGLLQLERA